MNELVSIIVPIYNKEDSLRDCIKTIIQQTYHKIEIILINDGSVDNSETICIEFEKKDVRVTFINKSNEGVSIARNTGIENSKGKYIMFVDPDDTLSPDIIEILIDKAERYSSDITVCSCYVNSDDGTLANSFFQLDEGYVEKERAIAQMFSNDHYKDAGNFIDVGVPWGKLYRRDLIKKNSLSFDSRLIRNQDNIFNLYAFQYSNSIYYIDEPLYNYDYDNFGSSNRRVIEHSETTFTTFAEEMIKFYEKFYASDLLLYQLLLQRLTTVLLTILSNSLCNPRYGINFGTRMKRIKKLCKSHPFNLIFESNRNYANTNKSKLIINLLKNKLYSISYFLYYIRFKMIKSI